MALEHLLERIENKKVIILGFGKEGVSTYRFIRRHFPKMKLVVADGNENLKTDEFADDKHVKFIKGKEYDRNLNQYDLIFKSPGKLIFGIPQSSGPVGRSPHGLESGLAGPGL